MTTFHRLKQSIGERVLEKFGYKCTQCFTMEDLCVHHIERKHISAPDYNDETNLTVLCRACHMKHHRNEGHIKPKGTTGNPNGRRGNKPPVTCKIVGCSKLQHGRALCHTHYEYYRKRQWTFD